MFIVSLNFIFNLRFAAFSLDTFKVLAFYPSSWYMPEELLNCYWPLKTTFSTSCKSSSMLLYAASEEK